MAIGLVEKFRGFEEGQRYYTVERVYLTPSGREDEKTWNASIWYDLYESQEAYKAGEPALDKKVKCVNVSFTAEEAAPIIALAYSRVEKDPQFDGAISLK